MVHSPDLILTLTGGLAAALVFGFVTQRLRLSPIVGYLLAGVAVGPFTPGFVAHGGIAEQFAELGVILLMFGVGLHFHLKELHAVRKVALPGAVAQIAVATGLGVLVTRSAGFSAGAGVVFGLAIAVASTVVLLRVLSDYDALHTPAGHLAVGWLLVEDVFTLNPLLFRLVDPLVRRLSARSPRPDQPGAGEPPPDETPYRTIVVGYGPVGRTLAKLLIENEIEPTVIELNHETVKTLHGEGVRAVYGDASQAAILERAGVKHAASLIFAASGSPDAVIRAAKALNPALLILARTTYVRDVPALRKAGSSVVVSAEAEVALAMTEHVLTQLGATGEQLDRARLRIRGELGGGEASGAGAEP